MGCNNDRRRRRFIKPTIIKIVNMKKFHVIDKTRKDQYHLPSVIQALTEQGWKQYKSHVVFYKKNENLINGDYTIMIPKVEILKCELTTNNNNYQMQLIVDFNNINNNTILPEHSGWHVKYIRLEDWNTLEDPLLELTIRMYKEGGCYTEALKYCPKGQEKYYYLSTAKYYTLTDRNRKKINRINILKRPYYFIYNIINDLKYFVYIILLWMSNNDPIGKILNKYINNIEK
jgi:hypothetical protein